MAQMGMPYIKRCPWEITRKDEKERVMTMLNYINCFFTPTDCHHPSCVAILHSEKVKLIENEKSEVSILLDTRFFVRLNTTRTSFKWREEVGENLSMWEIRREAPLPITTQFLPEYGSTFSYWAISWVIWVVMPMYVYQS